MKTKHSISKKGTQLPIDCKGLCGFCAACSLSLFFNQPNQAKKNQISQKCTELHIYVKGLCGVCVAYSFSIFFNQPNEAQKLEFPKVHIIAYICKRFVWFFVWPAHFHYFSINPMKPKNPISQKCT